MIATLTGRLKLRDPGRLIVETAGVGYEIFVPLNTYYRMPSVGAEVELEIRQIVREDAILLYGFATAPEKQAFDLLMSVQHVGAKLALAVLSVLAKRSSRARLVKDGVWSRPPTTTVVCRVQQWNGRHCSVCCPISIKA
jgi:Holliday junction resolvasome RuvABC DNA-binding subunit